MRPELAAITQCFDALGELDREKLSALDEKQERDERPLVCAACAGVVTTRAARIEVDGAHRHTFTNPSGIVFNIGCFGEAPGSVQSGEYTPEWSWFNGWRWCYAHCRHCRTHLGWAYRRAEGLSFFGLILERVVDPE